MENETKLILVDADGKSPRLSNTTLFNAAEWSQLRPLAMQHLGEDIVALVDQLPRMTDTAGTEHLCWWLPKAFESKQQVSRLRGRYAASAEGLGWLSALELSKHKKAFLAFCEAHADLNELGSRRKWAREYSLQNRQTFKPQDPFEGVSGIKRMLAPGARIETERAEDLLAMETVVIYDAKADAYLDAQMGWAPLNKARLFSNAAEAQEVIERRRLHACQTARVGMRVEGFSNIQTLGPKAREAWADREAEALTESTSEPSSPARTSRPRF